MSGPPSTALNHNYVPGMLHFHYNAATMAVDLLIIVPLTSMNTIHLFTKKIVRIFHKTFQKYIGICELLYFQETRKHSKKRKTCDRKTTAISQAN